MATCLIGLGSNLGDRRQNIARAVELLDKVHGVDIVAQSRLYQSSPIGGPPGQDAYLNAAVRAETSRPPESFLDVLLDVENQLGRRRGERWTSRTIDLDLLLYDDLVLATERLRVPHPQMTFRRFVLEPAAEIAADMSVPAAGGWSILQLRDHVDRHFNYVALAGSMTIEKSSLAEAVATKLNKFNIDATVICDPPCEVSVKQSLEFSSGPDSPAAIEFFKRRALALEVVREAARGTWLISDFWLDYGKIPNQLRGELCPPYTVPKLRVSIRSSPTPLDNLSDFSGPQLVLDDTEYDAAVDELTAAILAMHDTPLPFEPAS